MAEKPHFLKDLEIREMQSLDHLKVAKSIFQGIKLSSPPFCMALFGPWGSGKSTILKLLLDEIQRASREEDGLFYRTFWFNAWEYESSANLFYSLISLLINEIPDGTRYSRKGSAVVMRVAKAARIHGQRWSASYRDAEPRVSQQGSQLLEEEEIPLVESIRADLDRLTDMLLVVGGKGRPKCMVVFVDDLDKCLPLHGLALVESIKLFFSSSTPIVFLFAIDSAVLSQVVHAKYGYAEPNFAQSYIDKIFEFSYQIPNISSAQVSDLVDEVYRRSGLSERPLTAEQLETEQTVMRAALSRAGITLSPRRIKRIVNRFIWFLCHEPPLDPQANRDGEALDYWLTWLVATEQWPNLRSFVVSFAETAFKELGNRITGHPLFPHSVDAAKQAFNAMEDSRRIVDFLRRLIRVPDEPHLAESQEEMRRAVMRLYEIDGVLRSCGI